MFDEPDHQSGPTDKPQDAGLRQRMPLGHNGTTVPSWALRAPEGRLHSCSVPCRGEINICRPCDWSDAEGWG